MTATNQPTNEDAINEVDLPRVGKSDAPMSREWEQWDSAEILTRLIRRGVDPVDGKGLVRDWQTDRQAYDEVNAILNAEFLDENDKPIIFETPLSRRPRR